VTSRLVLAAAALAAVPLLACTKSSAKRGAADATPPPLPADVQTVATVASPEPGGTSGDARLSLTGEIVSPVRSDLVPRTGGRVGRVLVDEGQRVRKGQRLLELETDYLKLDVERAEAELARAAAAAEDAHRDFERKTGLLAKGSVSQAVFERSKAGSDQAEAARAAARAGLDLARRRLADAVLVSPVDGVVAARRTDVGERLGEASVAFVIEQTAPLKLRFRVPERYIGRVKPGQTVKASVDAYAGETFEGTVSVVGGSVEPETRTFLVEAELPNRDGRLQPGLFARVELDLLES
jgi:membrane fusion protein (multidrug efflux system)